ncbi:MAG: YlxR family protein [Clostridia bacterium]|nr:YlxR family protein [Clostridia bacterium]
MTPLRMCTVCRERKEKKDLIRIVCNKETGIAIDRKGNLSGRGAYLCRTEECVSQAQKRKVLERTFSRAVEAGVYEALQEELNYES